MVVATWSMDVSMGDFLRACIAHFQYLPGKMQVLARQWMVEVHHHSIGPDRSDRSKHGMAIELHREGGAYHDIFWRCLGENLRIQVLDTALIIHAITFFGGDMKLIGITCHF